MITPFISKKNFLLQSEYPDNFLSINAKILNLSIIDSKNKFISLFNVLGIIRRYIKPDITNDILLSNLWLDYCEIHDLINIDLTVDDINSCVNLAFSDTIDNLIVNHGVQRFIDTFKANTLCNHPKYYIRSKLSKCKEIKDYAKIAYMLTEYKKAKSISDTTLKPDEYYKATEYANILKTNKISINTFCNVLSYYDKVSDIKSIISYFSRNIISHFKSSYN